MQLKSRIIALPLAAVLASGALFTSAPAQATPKSKIYKGGAIALGALGAYMLSKGKTLEGAAAIGGGVLAYKQGQKESNKEKYGSNYNYNRNRYGSYNNSGYDNGYYNGGYANNGGYNNQPYYNGNASYNNGSDYNYDNSGYDNGGYSNSYDGDDSDRQCRDNGNGPGRNGRGHAYGHSKSNGRSWQR